MDNNFNNTGPGNEKQELSNNNTYPEPTMPPAKAALFALITIFLLYQIGGSILTILIFGFDFQNADTNAMRLLTAGGQVLLILAPTLIITKLVYQDITQIIRFRLPPLKELGIFIVGMIILIPLLQFYLAIQDQLIIWLSEQVPFIASIKELLDNLNEFIEATYSDLLRADGIMEGIFIVIIVSIIPSLCEEIFFRGFVMKSFEYRYSPFIAALITAIFFGLYHFNPYGLIALIILGVYMGFATYMSNSIVVTMTLHFINNFFAIMAFFIFGEEDFIETSTFSSDALPGQLLSFFALLSVFIVFIYYVKNYYKSLKTNEEKTK
jgi:membrane protease YdiL (CAAX protease family)